VQPNSTDITRVTWSGKLRMLSWFCDLAINRSISKSRIYAKNLIQIWLVLTNVIWPSFDDNTVNSHINLFHNRVLFFYCNGHAHYKIIGDTPSEDLWEGPPLLTHSNNWIVCYLDSLRNMSVYSSSLGIELRSMAGCTLYWSLSNKNWTHFCVKLQRVNLWYTNLVFQYHCECEI